MSDYPPGQSITEVFYEVNGTTGLDDGNFDKNLFEDGALSGDTVTISEISDGFYSASFEPSNEALYCLDIINESYTAVRYQKTFRVRNADASASALSSVASNVTTIKNRIPNTLSLANINAQVDTALADYDAPTKAELDSAESSIITEIDANETKIDTLISGVTVSTNNDKSGYSLSVAANNSIRDAVTDDIIEVNGSITLQQAISVILSAVAGETSGGGLTFSDPNGTSTRITATVDGSNNRTSITLTPSS